jgi:hypothetical protein
MKEYQKLINDLGDLKAEIQSDYENQIKTIQKRDEGWVTDTSGNLDGAKDTISQLDDMADDDGILLEDFVKDLKDVKDTLALLKTDNGGNKNRMDDLSVRDMGSEDYLNFLIKLSNDQKDIDKKIEDTKRESDELLRHLSKIKKDLDESDRTSKSEILDKCRNDIHQRLNKLPHLGDKVQKLEDNENKYFKEAELAQHTVDKSIAEYEQISRIDRKHGSSKKARNDKNYIEGELESIQNLLDQADISNVSMKDVLEIQERTDKVCLCFESLTEFVGEKLLQVENDISWLNEFLRLLRNKLKNQTDKFEKDMNDIMRYLTRFLKPNEKVKDSIQRPQTLKEILESTYFAKEELAYDQYKGYCSLVNTNLSK